MRSFDVVVAVETNDGIGINNAVPWKLPSDMKHFKSITTAANDDDATKMNAVIMGRKTWESIPQAFRPLSRRVNVVLSRNPAYVVSEPGVVIASSFTRALEQLSNTTNVGKIFVAGGTELYTEAIVHPCCVNLHVTRVHGSYECDAFFPPIDDALFQIEHSTPCMVENNTRLNFETWRRLI